MESLDNRKPLTGGKKKIEEYVNRIKNGESKDSIFQGLPESFISGVKKKLVEPPDEKTKQELNEIPSQYKGLDFEILKTQRREADQKKIEELRKQLGVTEEHLDKKNINYDLLKPEEVLIKLAEYCEPYMSAPREAVQDGTFAGVAKLKIEAGNIVLIRHAADENHLIKQGKNASAQEMMDSSLFSGGSHEAGAVHTSADVENWIGRYERYPVYGEFRIPVKDFLDLAKEGKVIIGNLGEAEIVISGDVAKKYLTKIIEKAKE
ncbi:hypothetical protein IPF86_03210 [Candidatus Nomurabacteria bacterium]|jgi:hypothetical protein|nr:MAG: hypothetical protein IPF86_03210 [Candidatus Nomurabacteria bacterium]